jgi:hypothetical protein
MFLLRRSALRFAQDASAPHGCATMFLAGTFELDTWNCGNPLAGWLNAALGLFSRFIPDYPPPIPIAESIGKGIGFSVGPTRRRLVASGSWSFKKMSAYMPCLARGRRLVSNSHTPIGIFGADDPCSCTSSHDAYQRTLAAGTSRQSPDRAGFSEVAAGNLAALVRIHV